MRYYVYTHSLDGEIFYVGKGCGTRAGRFTFRSERWNEFVGDRVDEVESNIVCFFENEKDAYDFETKLTALYISVGLCQANGSIGTRLTDTAKQLLKQKKLGNQHPSKATVALFPNGEQIKTASQKEMFKVMREKFDLSEGTIKRLIKTEQPFAPTFKRHKALEGMILKYVD